MKEAKTSIEKMNIPLMGLIGGAQHSLNIYRIQGSSPGPHVYLQSSVHGAEVQGNAVIFRLMEYLLESNFKGSLTFVPHANPMGANQKAGTYTQGRFSSTTGENWNRNYTDIANDPLFKPEIFFKNLKPEDREKPKALLFKQYLLQTISNIIQRDSQRGMPIEKRLGLTLQKLSASADIVLDLHTGPIATRYLYVAEYAQKKAQDFPFPFKIIIPHEFAGAMDEATFMPWLAAAKEMGFQDNEDIPFESYTVELGSEEKIDLKEAKFDATRILALLSKRGLIAADAIPPLPQREEFSAPLKDYKSYYKQGPGLVEYLKKPGDAVKKGDILYQVLDFSKIEASAPLENCLRSIKAQEDAIVINHNPSATVLEGTMVYQLLAQET